MRLVSRLLCLAPLALSACGEPGHYPLTGAHCSPDDPVHQMNECDFMVINLLPGLAMHPTVSSAVGPRPRPRPPAPQTK